ncbi:type IV pilus modification PilV family protein [Rhodomicrobium lacus]|uniref:type IV pilus modification PilV family protein n=1 Tax=Rhodomicrobium lacus TaxID=2498452 RepID=UPI000F8F3FBA|nr:hypothetical protein [Rhodomicrobium lacus]
MRPTVLKDEGFLSSGGEDNNGFVLVDALVSLIITGLVLGSLFAAISQSAAGAQRTADQYRAISYARSKIAELRATSPMQEGRAEGDFDANFSWSLQVTRNEITRKHETSPLVGLDVELIVKWRRGIRLYQRTYRTIVLQHRSSVTRTFDRRGGWHDYAQA